MILGVDPGLNGALCFYDGARLSVVDMPTRIVLVSRKERRAIDEAKVLEQVRQFELFGAEILMIEQVSGMPGQSGPAAFTFGYGVGVVTMAALACGLAIEKVAPSHWKAALGLKTAHKGQSILMAREKFPECADLFMRVKDDGRAEGALIAWYGWKTRGTL